MRLFKVWALGLAVMMVTLAVSCGSLPCKTVTEGNDCYFVEKTLIIRSMEDYIKAWFEPGKYEYKYMGLTTIDRRSGSNPTSKRKIWTFSLDASIVPVVINYGAILKERAPLDPLDYENLLDLAVFTEADLKKYQGGDRFFLTFHKKGEYKGSDDRGIQSQVVHEAGYYIVEVHAINVDYWWVKVGIEQGSESLPESTSGTQTIKTVYQDLVIGKWQHGLSQCPPTMDSRQCEKIMDLPENKLYYLEFLSNGEVIRTEDGQIWHGTYRFTGERELEITWESGDRVTYQLGISGDKMGLLKQGKQESTFVRLD
jgi:hypothetical protein